jgi:glyoxylase-like metal-dependent hydrolase (beta-lactamase superfamily II)
MDESSKISFYKLSLGITNCFLLSMGTTYLLIDTSLEKYYKDFKLQLTKLNIRASQISHVFLTHHHTDHTGFLGKILMESDATLIVHENALPHLEKGSNNPCLKPTTPFIGFIMKLRDNISPQKPSPSFVPNSKVILIHNDDHTLLPSIGLQGSILYLPGHTDDSIAIVLDNGFAFIGDVALNILGLFGLKHRPLVMEEPCLLAKAWEKLKNSGAKELHVSHGNNFAIEKLIIQ